MWARSQPALIDGIAKAGDKTPFGIYRTGSQEVAAPIGIRQDQ
jgi:hypothetical protein